MRVAEAIAKAKADRTALRDLFAGLYLAGRAAREEGISSFPETAETAFRMADRMIEAREK